MLMYIQRQSRYTGYWTKIHSNHSIYTFQKNVFIAPKNTFFVQNYGASPTVVGKEDIFSHSASILWLKSQKNKP